MSDAANMMTDYRHHSGVLDRAATLTSWALAVALFSTVGWLTMAPDDPLGAVSVLTRDRALVMISQIAALAVVVSALATVIAGKSLADVGTFAVALGLALVSLRGATAEYLLVQDADASGASHRGLALRFAMETVGWFGVALIAMFVASLVQRWCFNASADRFASAGRGTGAPAPTLAGYDIPRISAGWLGVSLSRQTAPKEGLAHMVTAVVVGFAAMGVLSFGLTARSIRHGQSCFLVAAAICIAVYIAQRAIPVRSVLWSVLAVGLLALLGYLWAFLRPASPGLPPNVPASPFLRILPVQFIAVGTASAVGMFWYVCEPPADAGTSRRSAPQRTPVKGRR
jgi:hypothetical protein